MVKVLLIIPYHGVQDQFQRLVNEVEDTDIKIEMIHIAGTTADMIQKCKHDVVVARGITYQAIRNALPDIHLVEISMTGFDVANAILSAIKKFHPSRIAILMHGLAISNIQRLEELCGIPLEFHDILNENEIQKAVSKSQESGADVFIGGLTMCQCCDRMRLNRIHIKTGEESVRLAIAEAVNAAKTINLERAKTNLLQAVFNSSQEVLIAVDRKGMITAINNQAYQTYKIPLSQTMIGKPVGKWIPNTDFKKTLETGLESETLYQEAGKTFLISNKPIIVDGQSAGVLITVQNAERISEAESKIRKEMASKGLVAKYHFEDIMGSSSTMRRVVETAYKYSQVDSNVLLIGDTGTGKELFANSIHHASRRSTQPFVAINCAALPESLLESELFGYAPGAFSGASKAGKMGLFELAHKGTIFLDEIGEMPIKLQAKLLRVLQERQIRRIGDDRVIFVDVRVISATNINILQEIQRGNFRADLYYRLNLLNLKIPNLEERREDIPEMVQLFISRCACDYARQAPKLTDAAMQMLCAYSWPGNVRELRNICERMVVLCESGRIDVAELEQMGTFTQEMQEHQESVRTQTNNAEENSSVEELMQSIYQKRMTQEELARALGISRTTLWRKIKQSRLK